jgi:Flp pilus assembly protein TadG
VTLWTILAVPVVMTILCVVVEVGRLWQARSQLENALEAAALAAVQEWGQRGGKAEQVAAGEIAGNAYARANAIHGMPVDLEDRVIVPAVAWAFGTATCKGTGFDFTPDPRSQTNLAVALEATARVPALFRHLFGRWIGESTVSASTAAYYDQSVQPPRPRLIRLNETSLRDSGTPRDGL